MMALESQFRVDDWTERAVQFEAGDGMVRGNVIMPDDCADRPGVLIIHGFGGVRSGPHNLLTNFARELGQAGFASIRFDLRGRGESDGAPAATTLADMAEDALAAANTLKREAGIRTIVLVGICSGGNVGIGILDRLQEVQGLFLLSVYPFGDADSFKRDAHRSLMHVREYWKKLWMPGTWKRLIRGEINFGIIARILVRPFKRAVARKEKEQESSEEKRKPLHNLLLHKPKLCMIYGDADPDYAASRDYYREFAKKENYKIDIRTIEGASHNFYSEAWKDRITTELLQFVKEELP